MAGYLMKNFLFVISLVLISCAPEVKELKLLQGNAIGTTYSIRYLDNKDQNFESKIDQIVKEINASTSTYLPNSIISTSGLSSRPAILAAI